MVGKTAQQALKYDYLGLDIEAVKRSIANRLEYLVGKDMFTATNRDWYQVGAYVVRDRLMERWMESQRTYYREDAKRVYYLSMEFLMGRLLTNSLLNMGFYDEFCRALYDIGLRMEDIQLLEPDAALGNGGLGRLAACYLDSMATLGLPGYGYGIRYEYGMFTQRLEDGRQIEHPENWLRYGNPWEFPRPEVLYPVSFYGRVVEYPDEHGVTRYHWVDTEDVMAMAYDTPVPGYQTNTVNNLRLWSAKATRDFNLKYFNEGNYIKAVEEKNASENLSKVLYPDDTTEMGRELRLKQQYFFVSASLQDILRRFLKYSSSFETLPDKAAVQLNDTHPVLAIPELMRLLVDVYHVEWKKAWDITCRTFSYTNHTLLPEALETWAVPLLGQMLPRHLQIIYEINHHFLRDVVHHFPGDVERMRNMSIIEEGEIKRVRMAHLAVVGSHKVNGVSALHTELLQSTLFHHFHQLTPQKIVNITNGITPRRWLNQANPRLSQLISARIGSGWLSRLEDLDKLAAHAEDAGFRAEFRAVKQANKERLAYLLKHHLGIEINLQAMVDVQVKRIHEYKRQLLNVLHVVTLYNRIRREPQQAVVPRTIIFGGKAAPAYVLAKLIIKLINDVADIVNNDPAIGDKLKVIFVPNYDVSTAQDIIPATDLSEQISTVGTEASGTSNMKFALNGALIIGTFDGANIEIHEAVGKDNIFIFGQTAAELKQWRQHGYHPLDYYHAHPELRQALDMIGSGYFSPEKPDLYRPIIDTLLTDGDRYMLLADYPAYVECQQRVSELYAQPEAWTQKAIMNVARVGYFSSDRAIAEYAEKIWNIKPVKINL